jgi:hypothetical protein
VAKILLARGAADRGEHGEVPELLKKPRAKSNVK